MFINRLFSRQNDPQFILRPKVIIMQYLLDQVWKIISVYSQ